MNGDLENLTEAPTAMSLWIREVTRYPEQSSEDRLALEPGVNVVVGVPNTGKSKWLGMIDYLFGNEKKPHEAFGEDLASKYSAVGAAIVVGEEEWSLKRSWKEEDAPAKIVVNGEQITLHAFTLKLMHALKIPVLHYPRGDPYSPRGWPELGWRSLLRHIYRRQPFWSELADKQPESEQLSCILQFVGIAEVVFSDQYAKMVSREKRIQHLENERDQFVRALQELSRDLVGDKGLGVALTLDSMASAIARQEAEISAAQVRREAILHGLLESVTDSGADRLATKDLVEQLGRELETLRSKEEEGFAAMRRTQDRLREFRLHRTLICEELRRLERAVEAGTLLADLKITHCPACDRPIRQEETHSGSCVLCQRTLTAPANSEIAAKRLGFEMEQLKSELEETDQFVVLLDEAEHRSAMEQASIEEQISQIQAQLRPVRTAASAVLPPELAVTDQETGRRLERISQLKRVRAAFGRRDALSAEIESLRLEAGLEGQDFSERLRQVNFARASDILTDGMNTYLNAIKEIRPDSWSQPAIDFLLGDRWFAIRIGNSNWTTKLGGTLTLLFLIAYQYALMTLTDKPGCHYPGLCILDFPADLGGVAVSDSETFALEPFVHMVRQIGQPTRQVIAVGRSFGGLQGAHRIELTKVWA